MKYVVTRHPGALKWISRRVKQPYIHLEHLEIDQHNWELGDIVIGVVPVPLIAQLIDKGVRYLHMTFVVDRSKRGSELSESELDRLRVSLHEYSVIRIKSILDTENQRGIG